MKKFKLISAIIVLVLLCSLYLSLAALSQNFADALFLLLASAFSLFFVNVLEYFHTEDLLREIPFLEKPEIRAKRDNLLQFKQKWTMMEKEYYEALNNRLFVLIIRDKSEF